MFEELQAILDTVAIGAVGVFGAAFCAVIHDNKKTRKLLKQFNKKEEELVDWLSTIPGGVGIFLYEEGKIKQVYLNDGYYRILETSQENRDAYKKEETLSTVHPEDVPKLLEAIEDYLQHYSLKCPDNICGNLRILKGDYKTYRWINLTAKIIKRENNIITFYCSFSDVEDEVIAKRELMESEATLQMATEISNMMYWEYYPKEHIARMSNKVQQEFDVTPIMENYPKSWMEGDFVVLDSKPTFEKMIQEIKDGAVTATCEVKTKHVDGFHWEQIRCQSMYDSEGRRIKVIAIAIDITEQKRAEQRYNRNMDSMMRMNPNAIGTVRLNLTKNWCGDGYSSNAKLIHLRQNRTADSFIKEICFATGTKENIEELMSTYARMNLIELFLEGQTNFSNEYCCRINAKTPQWIKVSTNLAKNPVSGDIEAIIYCTNINEDKIMQAMIYDSIAHDYDYMIYFDIHSEEFLTYTSNPKEMLIRGSNFFQEVYVRANQMLSKNEAQVVMESITKSVIIEELAKSDNYYIYYNIEKDHQVISRKKIRFSYVNHDAHKLLLTQIDITDSYLMEQMKNKELAVALHDAKNANNAKSEFLSRMSHDMRTPMNGIIGMANLALTEESQPQVKHYVKKIDMLANFLLGLINDILDMSKIESGKIVLKPEPYEIRELNEYLQVMIEPLCIAKNITFHYTQNQVDFTAVVDKLRINQIFFNLLSNAVKFTPPGGEVSLSYENWSLEEEYLDVDCIVRDNGIGMSEEFLQHAFEPFTQELGNGETRNIGSGLGLAIVKELVELMNGTIECKSELGIGTQFIVHLRTKIMRQQEWLQVSEVEDELIKLVGKRVLLCEDNDINTEIATLLLEKKGLLVEHAPNGRIAVDMVNESKPWYYDAILMDIAMPIMSGLEATKEIRQLTREDSRKIPIIAMTANAFKEDQRESREAGMNEHLAKPIEPEKLYCVLERYISA